jgi:hypothetical protein
MSTVPLPSGNLLKRQLKGMQSDKDMSNISAGLVDDNIYEWDVMLMISDDCKFYGGLLSTLVRGEMLTRGTLQAAFLELV